MRPVEAGSALKIEVSDAMLLGEAIYCRPDGDQFYLGVELDQALYSLMALGRSVREFSGADSGPQEAYAVQETDHQDQ